MKNQNFCTLLILSILTNLSGFLFAPDFLPKLQAQTENFAQNEMSAEDSSEFVLPDEPFARITRSKDGKLRSFDTSLVTFVSQDGSARVTLIGAVHIGEKAYFHVLNRRFKAFDAVLFEMVGDNDPRPVKASESGDVIGILQRLSASMMGLEFQIGSVDYHASNFVHADMNSAEFSAAMKRRRDGFLVWFLRSYGYSMAIQPAQTEFFTEDDQYLFEFLFAGNKARSLKCLNAAGISDLRSSIVPIEGKNGSSLISDRNDKALSVLEAQLKEGKKNVAIFYGAAHLPDFAEKLQTKYNMKPEKIEWIPCWDLR